MSFFERRSLSTHIKSKFHKRYTNKVIYYRSIFIELFCFQPFCWEIKSWIIENNPLFHEQKSTSSHLMSTLQTNGLQDSGALSKILCFILFAFTELLICMGSTLTAYVSICKVRICFLHERGVLESLEGFVSEKRKEQVEYEITSSVFNYVKAFVIWISWWVSFLRI